MESQPAGVGSDRLLAREITNQLTARGAATRGRLGAVMEQLVHGLSESFNVESRAGVLVAQVSDDSPAANVGLSQVDVTVIYRGMTVAVVGTKPRACPQKRLRLGVNITTW